MAGQSVQQHRARHYSLQRRQQIGSAKTICCVYARRPRVHCAKRQAALSEGEKDNRYLCRHSSKNQMANACQPSYQTDAFRHITPPPTLPHKIVDYTHAQITVSLSDIYANVVHLWYMTILSPRLGHVMHKDARCHIYHAASKCARRSAPDQTLVSTLPVRRRRPENILEPSRSLLA
jgi:hypothetical protein